MAHVHSIMLTRPTFTASYGSFITLCYLLLGAIIVCRLPSMLFYTKDNVPLTNVVSCSKLTTLLNETLSFQKTLLLFGKM